MDNILEKNFNHGETENTELLLFLSVPPVVNYNACLPWV